MRRKNLLSEFDKRYVISNEEMENELEKNIQKFSKMISKNMMLDEIKTYKANNLAFELGKLITDTDLVFPSDPVICDQQWCSCGPDMETRKKYDK